MKFKYTLGLDADTSRPILKNRKRIYITANYDKPKGSIYQEEILEEKKTRRKEINFSSEEKQNTTIDITPIRSTKLF